MSENNSIKPKLFLLVTMIFWASAFPGIKAALDGYSAGPMALFRFLVADLVLLIFYLRLPKRTKLTVNKGKWLVMSGIFFALYHYCLNYGEFTVSPAIASFIVGLSPAVMIILAAILFSERLKKRGWLGLLICLLGVVLIFEGEADAHVKFDYGVLFVLASALASTGYSLTCKPILNYFHAIEVTAWMVWFGTLFLLPFTPAMLHEIANAPMPATLSVVYLGIFPAGLAYLGWNYALANMSVTKASSWLYTLPFLATVIGFVWLGSLPSLMAFVGGIVALFGASMMAKFTKEVKKVPPQS